MEIKGWKKNSGRIAIVLDHDEFDLLRGILMQSKENHYPGDGTCNGHSYMVVNEICRMSFDEWMGSPKMICPGDGRADRITINLNSHDYTDFQELLENWFGGCQTDDAAGVIVGKIISTKWVMATDRIGNTPVIRFKQIDNSIRGER